MAVRQVLCEQRQVDSTEAKARTKRQILGLWKSRIGGIGDPVVGILNRLQRRLRRRILKIGAQIRLSIGDRGKGIFSRGEKCPGRSRQTVPRRYDRLRWRIRPRASARTRTYRMRVFCIDVGG